MFNKIQIAGEIVVVTSIALGVFALVVHYGAQVANELVKFI